MSVIVILLLMVPIEWRDRLSRRCQVKSITSEVMISVWWLGWSCWESAANGLRIGNHLWARLRLSFEQGCGARARAASARRSHNLTVLLRKEAETALIPYFAGAEARAKLGNR
jgi:hypothetical protein